MTLELDLDKLNFIMMIGIPGSGKTTKSKALASQLTNADISCVLISSDVVREELKKTSQNVTNDDVFKKVDSLMQDAFKNGCNVVYDATNCNPFYRTRMISKYKAWYNVNVIGAVLISSVRDALNANYQHDNVVPEDKVLRMYSELHRNPPSIFEGFDGLVAITHTTFNEGHDE